MTMIRTAPFVAAMVLLTVFKLSAGEQVFLGPPGPVPARGNVEWLTGANGAGVTVVDFNDPPKTGFDFVISNSVAGKGNNGDWRCPHFSLGDAADGAGRVTFSFAYKLAEPVAAGNNIHVQLRFFDAQDKFIRERVIPVGDQTRDSAMTNYRTYTVRGITVPKKAITADVWIDANIFEPWVSGTARFGDISVTTAPRSLVSKLLPVAAWVLAGCAVAVLVRLWRRRVNRKKPQAI